MFLILLLQANNQPIYTPPPPPTPTPTPPFLLLPFLLNLYPFSVELQSIKEKQSFWYKLNK